MYARKSSNSRSSAGRQSADVLLRILSERNRDLGVHLDEVTSLADAVADSLGLPDEERAPLLQAASLHDVGKAAIPDEILNKQGPLDEAEWEFMRRHTLIGERILSAAPALTLASKLVRSSHERFDGKGYPDRLAGNRHPARRAHHRGLRRLRRDGLRPPLPLLTRSRGGAGRAATAARAVSSTRRWSRCSPRCCWTSGSAARSAPERSALGLPEGDLARGRSRDHAAPAGRALARLEQDGGAERAARVRWRPRSAGPPRRGARAGARARPSTMPPPSSWRPRSSAR